MKKLVLKNAKKTKTPNKFKTPSEVIKKFGKLTGENKTGRNKTSAFKKHLTRKRNKTSKEGLNKEAVSLSLEIKQIDEDRQIVTGEVYSPYILDTHGDMMIPDDVETLCHRFMAEALNDRIDIMHNNKPALAVAVESYIARDNPMYNKGAWVVSVKIFDTELWDSVKAGVYNGYSIEMMVNKVPAIIEVTIQNQVFGITEENDGHDHAFYAKVNDDGVVISGHTSKDDDHQHSISLGTATEPHGEGDEKHAHRYFLP